MRPTASSITETSALYARRMPRIASSVIVVGVREVEERLQQPAVAAGAVEVRAARRRGIVTSTPA